MDYIYSDENYAILIEHTQVKTRKKVIDKYIQCRRNKNMTQAELSRRTGITRTNISRFESGKYNPSLDIMVKIATALDMDLDILLENHDTNNDTDKKLEKYHSLYDEIKNFDPDDTLQLALNARTDEEKNFFMMIGDYILQQRQQHAIERNLF